MAAPPRKTNVIQELLHPFKGSFDARDPIFDSESEDGVYFECYQPKGAEKRHEGGPVGNQEAVPLKEFLRTVCETILPDGFASGDSGELCEALKRLHSPAYHDVFVYKAIRASMDFPEAKQQWMSEVLTILYDSRIITRAQASRAFEKLVQQAEDIKLDVPDAYWKIMTFARCAVEDGVLAPSFLNRLPESFLVELTETGQQDDLKQHLQRFKEYKAKLENYVVKEFLISGSLEDLPKMLEDLGHPEFRHEVVRRLIKAAMGRTDVEREVVSVALSSNFGTGDSGCFSSDDILVGFLRLFGELEDVHIDVPDAPALLTKFLVRAIADELLPPIVILDLLRLGFGGEEGRRAARMAKEWVLEVRQALTSLSRFQRIWTATDPDNEESRRFKNEIRTILTEHFADEDTTATRAALDALEMTPDQGPEFVRKALEFAMERGERERVALLTLFKSLMETSDLNERWLEAGFDACMRRLPELQVDIPLARDLLNELAANAKERRLLPGSWPTTS